MRLPWRVSLSALAVLIGLQAAQAQVKIMPLGDSITEGYGSSQSPPTGYRDDLAAMLTASGVNFDFVGSLHEGTGFDPDHEGHPGFRADNLSEHVLDWLQASQPDVVILQTGTNDLNEGASPNVVLTRILSIVTKIQQYNPQTKILLVSLLPRTDATDAEPKRQAA